MSPWARHALILVAIWSVPGAISAASMYVVMSLKGEALPLVDALLWRMPEWQVWAVATPIIVWLGRRCPPWRRGYLSIPVHLVANAVFGSLDVIVYWASARLVGPEPFASMPLGEIYPWLLLKTAFFEMLIYGAIIGADYGLAYQRRYREGVLKQSQLEARLASTQLQALKMQLHPHFLFNTINAINVLMRKGETAAALRMLNGMSDLLRRSLTSMKVELVPLSEELDFIERYLEIEQTRFSDRLRVTYEIDPATRDALLPGMILQPIVENAIEHGIAPRAAGGAIAIAARVYAGKLVVEIRDDGVGLAAKGASAVRPKGHGVGLSHVRKRLAQLYPGAHRFTLEPAQPAGVRAQLEIAFTTENTLAGEPS